MLLQWLLNCWVLLLRTRDRNDMQRFCEVVSVLRGDQNAHEERILCNGSQENRQKG